MCGIAAFSGKKRLTKEQSLIAANKMKILGLYNESRGSHGCGLYINGNIHKGIEDLATKKDTKLFHNFIGDPGFVWPKLNTAEGHNLIILHTRQATLGAHTEANTHPFRIHSQNPINDIVGVHNGTIDNIWELCRKHNFDFLDKSIRVDSHALYYLLDIVGTDILTQYRGAAALVYTKTSDPNSLFVYHGQSKKDRTDQREYIERPLFYLRTPEGVFFSSLENSLMAIRESDKQEVVSLPTNKIMKVTNGIFTDEVVEINRVDANLYVPAPYVGVQQGHQLPAGTSSRVGFNNLREAVASRKANANIAKALGTPKTSLVWNETKPAKALAAKDSNVVFFWKGRFHCSAGDTLCKDLMWIGERGIIGVEGDEKVKPFWFYDGVMMRSKEAYEELITEANLPNSWVHSLNSNYAYDISRFSAFPVTHLSSESVDADPFFKYSWYLDEKRVTCKLRPEFSGRCYDIADGFLKEIIGSNGNDKLTVEKEAEDYIQDGVTYPAEPLPTLGCGTSSCNTEERSWKRDTSVFDIVFKDVQVVCEILESDEVQAIADFMEDQLKKDNLPHDPQTVQAEMWTAIRTGCAANKNIRQAVGDKTSVLEAYLSILKEEKRMSEMKRPLPSTFVPNDLPFEVDSTEAMCSVGEQVMSEMQAEYARYSKRDESKDTPFPNNLDELVANGSFHQAELLEDETDEPLIDVAVREDMRGTVDQGFHRIQQKHLEEQYQKVQAIKRAQNVVQILGELSTNSEELSVNESELGQDLHVTIHQGLGSMKASLTTVFEAYQQDDLVKSLHLEVTA